MEAYLYCEKCNERCRSVGDKGASKIDVPLKKLYEAGTSRCPVCGRIAHVRLVVENTVSPWLKPGAY